MIPSPEATATVMACIFAIIPVGWMVGAFITQLAVPMFRDCLAKKKEKAADNGT